LHTKHVSTFADEVVALAAAPELAFADVEVGDLYALVADDDEAAPLAAFGDLSDEVLALTIAP
jgi:hypothetical protein